MTGFTDDLAGAIARFEGGPSWNPCNLRAWGDYPVDSSGYTVFPDYQTAWAACLRQTALNIGRGLNLYEFFGGKPGVYPGYAPAADNNQPVHYAQVVAGWLGIDPTVPLTGYQGQAGPSSGTPGPSAPAAQDEPSGAGEYPGSPPTPGPPWGLYAGLGVVLVTVWALTE